MVSYGFYGSATTINVDDFEVLKQYGFHEDKTIGKGYHNDFYVLPVRDNLFHKGNELRIVNVCRFLDVEVYEAGVNSLFNTNLKMDILLKKGDIIKGFQAKSSYRNCLKYLKSYEGKQLDPYYSVFGKKHRKNLENLSTYEFSAPGVTYMSIKGEGSSMSKYLWELSKWLEIPIKEEYKQLLSILLKAEKPLAIRTLEKVLHTKNVAKWTSDLQTIYPISMRNGDVQLKRQRETTRTTS